MRPSTDTSTNLHQDVGYDQPPQMMIKVKAFWGHRKNATSISLAQFYILNWKKEYTKMIKRFIFLKFLCFLPIDGDPNDRIGLWMAKNRKVKIGKKLNKCHFAQFTFSHQGSEKIDWDWLKQKERKERKNLVRNLRKNGGKLLWIKPRTRLMWYLWIEAHALFLSTNKQIFRFRFAFEILEISNWKSNKNLPLDNVFNSIQNVYYFKVQEIQ